MVAKEIASAIRLVQSELDTRGKVELGPEAANALLEHLNGAVDQAMVLEATTLVRPCTGITMPCPQVRAIAIAHLTRRTPLTAEDVRTLCAFVVAHEQRDAAITRTKQEVRRG